MTTTEKLCALINERAAFGLEKYKKTLDRDDYTPEQWAQHAIEEMLDGAGYLMRLKDEIQKIHREIAELRNWKAQAMAVEAEWNPNELASLLGGTPGESQRVAIQREAKRLLVRESQLERELAGWKLCAAMLHESLNPPQGPSGEAIIDQRMDAEELFKKLINGSPIDDKFQRIKDAGDLLFEELDDLTPEENCECSPHGWDCASCLFKGARAAIKAWKEANK